MSGGDGERVGASGAGRRGAGRAGTVLLALAAAALLLLAATRPWLAADLPPGPGGGAGRALEVAGSTAAPLVPALGLVALAGAVALSTLRGAGRVLASLLLVLAGAGAAAAAVVVLAGPSVAAADAVRSATGVTGGPAASARATAWAALALVPAAAVGGTGLLALVRGRRWGSSARFEAPSPGTAVPGAPAPSGRAGPAGGRAPSSAALWDDLSAGGDPTSGAGGSGAHPA